MMLSSSRGFSLVSSLGASSLGLVALCFSTGRLEAEDAELPRAESLVLSKGTRDWLELKHVLDRGLGYLKGKQLANGAVGARYPVAVASLAGMAVLGAGYHPHQQDYGSILEGCLRYLEASLDRKLGFITEPESESRMHGHCYAILFLTQLTGCLSPEEEAKVSTLVKTGLKTIERAQTRAGGWYYGPVNEENDEASVTVCALQALRAAHNVGFLVDPVSIKFAIDYVKKCQLTSGSFCYSLAKERTKTSYALTVAALSTLNAAGVYESPELRKGLDYVEKTLARYPRLPWKAAEEEFEFYANLYAAQTLFQEGGPLWVRWYSSVRDYLVKKQRPDGSWECPRFGDEFATAVALLILEIPLGYLPIFQR